MKTQFTALLCLFSFALTAQEPTVRKCNTVRQIVLYTPGKQLPDTITFVMYQPDTLVSYSTPKNTQK